MSFRPERHEGSNTNDERATRAEAALTAYVAALKDASSMNDEDTIADILCDIRHFCDREEIDFDAALKSSELNWEAER